MPNNYFFTIDLLIRSDTNLKRSINSVIDNEKFFRENIQLILIDSIGSELSTSVCAEYTAAYPENIYFVDAVGKNPARSYNDAFPISAGTYVAFTDNYGCYSKGALRTAMEIAHSGKIPVFCIQPIISMPNVKDTKYVSDIDNGIVRLHDTPDKTVMMLGCHFFKRKLLDKVSFDSSLRFHYDARFIVEALLLTYSYVFTDRCSYITLAPTEKDGLRFAPQYSQSYYTRAVREFILPMLRSSHDSVLVQSAMMYLLEIKFSLNQNDRYNNIIVGSHIREFFDVVADAMGYIDDTVILNKRLCRICSLDEEMPFRFLRMKYKNPSLRPDIDIVLPKEETENKYYIAPNRMQAVTMKGEFAAHIKNVYIGGSRDISADIVTLNYDKDGIYADVVLNGCSYLSDEDFSVFAVVNDDKMAVIPSMAYTLVKYFDKSFFRRYTFRLFIPIKDNKKMDTVCLCFRCGKLAFRMPMTFSSINSGISGDVRGSFLRIGNKILTYDAKNKCIVLRRTTDSLVRISESRMMSDAASHLTVADYARCRQIRFLAKSAAKEKGGKKILLFYEDNGINYNGSLLFRYFFKNINDKFIPYICVRRDSPEMSFLRDRGYENILETGSSRAMAVALAADYIFASSDDPYTVLGFGSKEEKYLRDLISARIVSVRNKFLTYHTAQTDNRLKDNTQLLFVASEREKNNLLSPVYDYDADMIIRSGNPLLDAVSDKRSSLILIAPGERRLFNIYDNSDYYRFSDSSFFKAYDNLISDSTLLDYCSRYSYSIALLLPRQIWKFRKLFHTGDYVSIYDSTEQNEASLSARAEILVTDYSDLQYRFAYKNKAVAYFYPPGLPVTSEHSGENISRFGFGEIFTDGDKLTEYLTSGIKGDFSPAPEYEKRSREFFSSGEKGNCQKIYEFIMKMI